MNIAGKKKEISKMKIASGKFLRFAGNIALLLVAGGCATTEVERLEKAIIEKDYMAEEEIARLRSLAYPDRTDDNKPVHASPDAVAAYERVAAALSYREKYFGREILRGVVGSYRFYTEEPFVVQDEMMCPTLAFALACEFEDLNMTNEKVRFYGMAASNGLWLAQKWLYEMYLNGSDVAKSYDDAAVWLKLASLKGDAVAADKLAELYETGKVNGASHVQIANLYNLAAQSYVKQWRVATARDGNELERLMVEFNGSDLSRVSWYNMDVRMLNDAITRCFEKAISLGDKDASDCYSRYKEALADYVKRGPSPEFFWGGMEVKVDGGEKEDNRP